jgi:hypothetical protein
MTSATIRRAPAHRSSVSSVAVSSSAVSPSAVSPSGAIRVDARGDRLWRVSTSGFAVVGHVELLDTAGGEVFLAKRYSPTYARFVDHGRFWTLEDAVACLRTGG